MNLLQINLFLLLHTLANASSGCRNCFASKSKYDVDNDLPADGQIAPCPNGRLILPSADPLLKTLYEGLQNNDGHPKFTSYFDDVFAKYADEMRYSQSSNMFDLNGTTIPKANDQDTDYRASLRSGHFWACGQLKHSGSRFFFTQDSKFVLKTIYSAQIKLLQKIIDRYVKQTTGMTSLLAKILGVFKVGDEYVIVMDNALYDLNRQPGGNLEVYDLKIHDMSGEDHVKQHDLVKIKGMSDANRNTIKALLARDIDFLETINVNDYSVLIGLKGQHISVALIDTLSPFHGVWKAGQCVGLGCTKYLSRFNTPSRYGKLMKNCSMRYFKTQK